MADIVDTWSCYFNTTGSHLTKEKKTSGPATKNLKAQ